MAWPTVVDTTGMDADTDVLPRSAILDLTTKFNDLIAMRGVASGVCDLDASAKVPNARLATKLAALAALNTTAGLVEQTGADTFAKRAISATIKGLLDASDAASARTAIGANALTALDAYPVGAVYISVVATSPATLFGGTWVAFGAGRVLVGIDATQTEFDTVEETGGAKTHTLTTTEMPSHTHTHTRAANGGLTGAPNGTDGQYFAGGTTAATGGGGAHNNLQPYIVCYFWKRTA